MRAAAVAIAAAGLLLAAAPARADQAAALAEWLPADAPVLLRIDPAAADGAMARANQAGIPGLSGNGLLLARLAARAALGFDPTSSAGWHQAGFDRDAPILVALAQIDSAAAARAYQVLGDGDEPPEMPVWHTRVVWQVRHAASARDALRAMIALAPGQPLAGEGLVAARTLAPGTIVAVRLRGDVVVIDLLASYAGGESAAELLARLPDKPAGSGFRPRLAAGAARELERPGITGWIDPARAIDAWVAYQQSFWVRRARDQTSRPEGSLLDHAVACAGIRAAASEGAFTDVAVRIEANTAGATSRTVWGLRDAYGLAAQLIAGDDQLLDPNRTDAVVAGALYLRSLTPLRALPRSEAFSGGLRHLRESIGACGPASAAAVAVIGWPQLAGMMLEEIAGIGPEAETLVASLRNIAVAIEHASLRGDRLVAAAEISVDRGAAPLLERIAEVFFGSRAERPGADRPHTTWGTGPARVFRWADAGTVAFGAGRGGRSVRWYLGAPAPDRAAPAGRLGHLIARPDAVARQLGVTGVARTILGMFSRVEAVLALDGDLLVATWSWTP